MKKLINPWLTAFFLLLTFTVTAQEFGLASYYSDRYQGRRTAYGDVYDKNKRTCSHKKHPYGTLLRITRLDNKKSVICKVIDKGPYTKGRIVDLSRAAAEELDLIRDGTAEVKLEVYQRSDNVAATAGSQPSTPSVTPQPERSSQEREPARVTTPAETAPVRRETTPAPVEPKPEPKVEAPVEELQAKSPMLQEFNRFGIYRIRLEEGPKAGFGVQVLAVSDYESLMKAIASFQSKGYDNVITSIEPGAQAGQVMYKVLIGPYPNQAQAEASMKNLKRRHRTNGFIVNFSEKSAALNGTAPAAPANIRN